MFSNVWTRHVRKTRGICRCSHQFGECKYQRGFAAAKTWYCILPAFLSIQGCGGRWTTNVIQPTPRWRQNNPASGFSWRNVDTRQAGSVSGARNLLAALPAVWRRPPRIWRVRNRTWFVAVFPCVKSPATLKIHAVTPGIFDFCC